MKTFNVVLIYKGFDRTGIDNFCFECEEAEEIICFIESLKNGLLREEF